MDDRRYDQLGNKISDINNTYYFHLGTFFGFRLGNFNHTALIVI